MAFMFLDKILVYGYELEAFCCMEALLKLNISGEKIIYAEPVPSGLEKPDTHTNILLFNDYDIEQTVHAHTKAQRITILSYYYLYDLKVDDASGMAKSAQFETNNSNSVEIPFLAMFVYADKLVSQRTYTAINNAGLVFDGRLVIERDCRTNDPNIYAAGTCTKYSRKYYADHMQHR